MDELEISAENLALFEGFYRARLAEAATGGIRDDAEELAIARDILQAVVNDGLTPTADGGASFVRRGARDWSDPATVQAARTTLADGGRRSRAGAAPVRSKELLQGVGMLVGVLALIGWFLWPRLFGSTNAESVETAAETTVESTPAPAANGHQATSTPIPTLETELLADIVDAGGVKTGPVVPRTLEIKGVSFIVQPVRVTAGDWPLPDDERAVSWVYGTVVNYVLGLEATPANKALLASLRPGDGLLLRMSTGPAFRFALADVVRVAPQSSEVFAQARPGLALVLLGEADQSSRVVIRAVYLPGQETPDKAGAATVAVGQAVTLDDSLRVTCLGGEPQAAEAPPGYIPLAVEFAVENRLDESLATAAFVHYLDGGQLRYPPLGGVEPRLPDRLEPGRVVTATARYAVPEAALGRELLWHFAPDPAGRAGLTVLLPPYRGRLAAAVGLEQVDYAGGRLLIELHLQAPDWRGLEVGQDDLALAGGQLDPTGSTFPWRLDAGRSGRFSLAVQPETSPLRLSLLEQGFEIGWQEEPMTNP